MVNIAEVHLLVHPDYHAIRNGNARNTLSPLQLGLRLSWDQRVDEISGRGDNVLVYLSALVREDMIKPHSEIEGIKLEDVTRIDRYRRKMDGRFILFPSNIAVTQKKLLGAFEEHGFVIDPDLKLFAFGEYQEHCVLGEGENAQDALGLSDSRFFIERKLSLEYRNFDPDNNTFTPRKER